MLPSEAKFGQPLCENIGIPLLWCKPTLHIASTWVHLHATPEGLWSPGELIQNIKRMLPAVP